MSKWKRLDLRKNDQRPEDGELVAIRMEPKIKGLPGIHKERYEIGRFQDLDGQGKLWWCHSAGTSDPARLKKTFDIWWCPVTAFDGI